MHPTFSVLLPTAGKPTLARAIESVTSQWPPGDELLVLRNDRGLHGNDARQSALDRCLGDFLLFLDDDDVYLPGAFAAVRAAVQAAPDRPHVFMMLHAQHGPLWQDTTIRMGNVGGQMFVVPNFRGKLGRWGERYEGDFDFIASALERWPAGALLWHEEAIVVHNAPAGWRAAERAGGRSCS